VSLSSKKVAKLLRDGKAGRFHDDDGLYLEISSKRAASWVARFQLNQIERYMGLGSARTFGLAEARGRNRKLVRQPLADKIDPLAQRRTERAARAVAAAKAMTFAEAAQQYFEQHESKWKNRKHSAQFISTLREYAYPIIGSLPIGEIDTSLVLKVLEQKIAAERGFPAGTLWSTRPETASRLRGRVENVLSWATVRGSRQGDNPARWRGHLANVLPARSEIAEVEHHVALPFGELPEFVAALRSREGVAARALEFCILTAARTGEIIGATWDEIDLKAKVWTVPANRIKGGKEHKVPLSDRALALLKTAFVEDGNPYIFVGPRSGGLSNMAMAAVLKRMGLGVTIHGFRSTFRDWVAERTNYPNFVAEAALAHVVGDKVEAAYRRGDLFNKRARLMQDWAKFCGQPPARATGKVVPFRGRG
jgi:integrase